MDTISNTLQYESNQRRIVSFIKQEDLLGSGQDENGTIYGSFSSEVIIYHEWSSDSYKMRRKESSNWMTEDEISVWIKEVNNPHVSHAIKDTHDRKINSLNFNNPLNINGRNIIDVNRLWEIDPKRKTEYFNKFIQQHYAMFDAGDDEFTKDVITRISAEYEAMQEALRRSKIKVLDKSRKENNENYTKERENRANGLKKDGSVNKEKISKSSQKFDIKRDPLYSKYANDESRIRFFSAMKYSLDNKEAHAKYEMSPMYEDSKLGK